MTPPSVIFALLLMASGLAVAQISPTQSSGTELLQAGKFAEAREAFEAVLDANPEDADAQAGEVTASEQLALEARGKGHADDALRALLRAQEYAPKNSRLLFDLGIQEDEMSLYQDADKTLATVEQLKPGDPQVEYAVARVKLDLGELDAAREKMQAYLKSQPNDAGAHYGLGRAYQLKLDVDHARVEFQRSIELQPAQTEAYYQLGDIALDQGNFVEAIANFNKTLTRNPSHGGALAGTGQAYFKQKQYSQAEDFLERAVIAAPEYEKGHYYLGLTLARLGRKEDSERELAIATKLANEANKNAASGLHLILPAANQ
ncbi:MAG: tetratricopeptide repeat protein [Terracidiphilus sp.]|jgi:tetratricopeptide (TPR) repeat protein